MRWKYGRPRLVSKSAAIWYFLGEHVRAVRLLVLGLGGGGVQPEGGGGLEVPLLDGDRVVAPPARVTPPDTALTAAQLVAFENGHQI